MAISLATLGSGLVDGASLGLVAVGFSVVYRGTKVVNFASGAQMLLGGYVGWELATRLAWPYWAATIVVVLAGGASGVLADVVGVRTLKNASQLVQVINLFAVSEAAAAVYLSVFGPNTQAMRPYAGATPLIGGIDWSAMDVIILGVTTGLVLGMSAWFRYTEMGLHMRCIAANPTGSAMVGLNPSTLSGVAWFVGGALASLSGLLVFPTSLLDPGLAQQYLFEAFAAVALGGLGSLMGGLMGGLLLGVVTAVVGGALGGTYTGFVGVAVLGVVMVARPTGILNTAQ